MAAPRSSADPDLSSRLRSVSAAHLHLPAVQLRPDALLVDDLGLDSLAAIEWGMVVEDALGIALPEDACQHTRTDGQVEDLVLALRTDGAPT